MLRKVFFGHQMKSLLKRHRDIDFHFKSMSSDLSPKRNYLTIGILTTSIAGIGGIFYYTKVNTDFRKSLETKLPTSKHIFDALFGPIKDPSSTLETNNKQQDSKPIVNNQSNEELNKKIEKDISSVSSIVPEPTQNSVISSQPPNNSQMKNKPADKTTEKLDTIKSFEEELKEATHDIKTQLDKKQLEIEYAMKERKLQEEYETELRKQLKRQLSVYVDHLKEELENQRSDIRREANLLHEEEIQNIKKIYNHRLSSSMSKLADMEMILKSREAFDEDESKSRKVWLICQDLKENLKANGIKAKSSVKEEVTQVIKTIESMREPSNIAIIALRTIPKPALDDGVYNEDTLIERFKTVDRVCKRVALIGDNGGSLGLYFLSYLQSLLISDNIKIPVEELQMKICVDPSKWDTFDILARVRHCLNQRDLELALRYANQLKGKARNVAQEWIKDIRLHLEVRQATDIIQAASSVVTIRSLK